MMRGAPGSGRACWRTTRSRGTLSILYISRLEIRCMLAEMFFLGQREGLTDFRVLLNFFTRGLAAIVGISECAFPVLELLPQLEGLDWLQFGE